RAGLIALFFLVGMYIFGLPRAPVTAQLKMSSSGGETGEIFYRSHDDVFTQGNSRAFVIQDDGKPHDYTIELPVSRRIDRIRIDPASEKGKVVLHALEVRDAAGVQRFDGRDLFDARGRVNQARLELAANGELLLQSFGNDPYVEIILPRPASGPHPVFVALQRLLLALAASVLLTGACAGIMRARSIRARRARPRRWGRWLDDDLLVFTPPVFAAFALIAATAVLFVCLK